MTVDMTFEKREEIIRREEREEGRIEGRIEGIVLSAKLFMQNMNLTADQALDILNISGEERDKVAELLK